MSKRAGLATSPRTPRGLCWPKRCAAVRCFKGPPSNLSSVPRVKMFCETWLMADQSALTVQMSGPLVDQLLDDVAGAMARALGKGMEPIQAACAVAIVA